MSAGHACEAAAVRRPAVRHAVRGGRLLAEKRGLDLNKKLIFLYTSPFFASKVISDPGDNANERQSTYLQEAQMEFWHGMILGLFIGANTGLVMAAVFKGCKRELGQAADLEDWLHMDEAVMEDTPALVSKSPRPVAAASPHSFPHS